MNSTVAKETVEKLLVAALFFLISLPVSIQAAPFSGSDDEKKAPVLSSIETYKKAETTQKTYQYGTNGKNKNSRTVEYAQNSGFATYEDKDRDGRFGEKEAAKTDTDLDGRKGENEAQLGTEQVSQNQKVTVLNNMGIGNSLSSFKAAGQTNRSTIVEQSHRPAKAKESSSAPEKDDQDKTSAAKTHRVLVS